ncbi:type IV pilin N-terminal domain-containing protein [Natrinema salinisoli]|uniref:type IV pilin N-terminal domain-containing protein n=1 Tax=Natrinema salinisoli TaxID=2878535 RepID=UPI001CF0894F|nr:type IV pilin N-terminal domain-containing protein [Natrinema salinisoli]
MWTDQFRGGGKTGRGVSPVVGVVLLVAIVLIGVTLVLTVGSSVLDGVQSEANSEQVYMCMDESDHRLNTVAMTGQEQPMGFDDQVCQPQIDGHGTLSVTWYNNSDGDPNWSDDDRAVSEDLGTYEFELEDGTLAHQGGGVWERTDSGVRVDKSPDIGFGSNSSLQLNFMQLNGTDNDGAPPKAQRNHEAGTNLTKRLANITEDPAADDFAIRIESEYADGWERHFEQEAEGVTKWNVSVNRTGENIVVVTAGGIGNVSNSSSIEIDSDRGLIDQSGNSIDNNLVEKDDKFWIDATLTNSGETESTVTATVSVWDGSDLVEERTIESEDPIGNGEEIRTDENGDWNDGNEFFDTESGGSKSIDLDPGNRYEYDIETDPGGNTLNERGSFYYLNEDPHYSVVNSTTTVSGGLVNISAVVQNLGNTDGSAQNVTLEITPEDGNDTATSTVEVELNSTEAANVSWSLDESKWPKGDYEFTVETDDDDTSGTFEVENGGVFEISEDLGIPEEKQLNGSDGQVITEEDDVTIGANITSTYAAEQTQNVTLEVLDEDGNAIDSVETEVTIGAGDTERVELTAPPVDAGEIYEYDLRTEGDSLDELGSFLVIDEPAQLFIDETTVVDESVKPGEPLAVEVDIRNRGEDGEQFVWIEGFDGNVVTVQEVALDGGTSTTATLEWGSVGVPDSVDNTTVTVQTNSDEDTAEIDVEPLLLVNDVTVDDPVAQGESVAIDAEVEGVAGDATQNVVLEDPNGDRVDSQEVTVSGGESETVELEYETDGNAITDRVTVRTDDDETEEVVVVERDGPDCSAVRYAGSGTSDDPYEVSTVDQLQCIDTDLDANYELVDDIDAQGTEYWNGGAGFEPIGDQERGEREFSGNFDGNGNAIEGLHIDRPDEDFVGLFAINTYFHETWRGIGEGSKIHNLRLENVSVHGRQVTGGLVGAAGGTIENVRVSGDVTAEHQEVGGIVGSSHNADLDNRLVSEATVSGGIPAAATDEVSHPWDARNMGIGGVVGSTGYNTKVSTAYSQADVEGPFAVGGIVGWTSDYASENEQMYWAEGDIELTMTQPEIEYYLGQMDRPSHTDRNTGGAIFGRGDDTNDEFDDSVYYNEYHHSSPFGEHVIGDEIHVNERTTDEMQGLEVTESGNLGELDYEDEGGPWVAIPDEYPRFAWELAAEGAFQVTIDDVENVTAGEAATVEVTVTSLYENREETDVEQTIALEDPDGRTVDTETVTLSSELGETDEETIELVWQTGSEDNGTAEVSVRSEDTEDSAPITIEPAEHGPGASHGPGVGPAPGDGSIDDDGEPDVGPGEASSSGDDLAGSDSEIDIDVDVVEVN